MSPLGLKLTEGQLRCAVALRLGAKIRAAHTCCCGQNVDEYGNHELACKRSAGRFARHAFFNDFIRRSLASVGVPSALEPAGCQGQRANDPMVWGPFLDSEESRWYGAWLSWIPLPRAERNSKKAFQPRLKPEKPWNMQISRSGDIFSNQSPSTSKEITELKLKLISIAWQRKILITPEKPTPKRFLINACQWSCNSLSHHAWLGPFETTPRSLWKKYSICPNAPERRN